MLNNFTLVGLSNFVVELEHSHEPARISRVTHQGAQVVIEVHSQYSGVNVSVALIDCLGDNRFTIKLAALYKGLSHLQHKTEGCLRSRLRLHFFDQVAQVLVCFRIQMIEHRG